MSAPASQIPEPPASSFLAENTSVFINGLADLVGRFLHRHGASSEIIDLTTLSIALTLVIALAFLANYLAKRIIVRVVDRAVKRTPWTWDNDLAENKVFLRLSHLAPAFIFNSLGRSVFESFETTYHILGTAVAVYVIIVILMVFSAVLNTIRQTLEKSPRGQEIPIKGFFQAIKLVVIIIGVVLVLSFIFGESPVFFLSGIGAMTAVLLLIFRDAILGLVAGVMISVNQLVRIGDWVEMPGNGADGVVTDVSLTTVKVRNWDRTITTIPSYDLISKSFKNWRGMFENQGRRIKRSIFIDTQTIDFVDQTTLERLMRIHRLRPYLEKKREEIAKANDGEKVDLDMLCNGRRLTNLGTFRAYCVAYLSDHPEIKQEELLIVRQLQPTEHGLPLEIYCFSKETAWVAHEATQADVFDHLLSIVSEFGLRVFQDPSGYDIHSAFCSKKAKGRNQPSTEASGNKE